MTTSLHHLRLRSACILALYFMVEGLLPSHMVSRRDLVLITLARKSAVRTSWSGTFGSGFDLFHPNSQLNALNTLTPSDLPNLSAGSVHDFGSMYSRPHLASFSPSALLSTTFAYWMNSSLFAGLAPSLLVAGKCPVSLQCASIALSSTKSNVQSPHRRSIVSSAMPLVAPAAPPGEAAWGAARGGGSFISTGVAYAVRLVRTTESPSSELGVPSPPPTMGTPPSFGISMPGMGRALKT
mmetsp:Transcript_36815/g.78488  ORF Transcript_36815/g.78488 Transcript_36815/m.78488 type:complete len:239 (+) Transcript_36815:730-1446(+)